MLLTKYLTWYIKLKLKYDESWNLSYLNQLIKFMVIRSVYQQVKAFIQLTHMLNTMIMKKEKKGVYISVEPCCLILCQGYISQLGWETFSNLWGSNYWKMYFVSVKKLKVDILLMSPWAKLCKLLLSQAKLSLGFYHPPSRGKLLIPPRNAAFFWKFISCLGIK